MISGFASKTLWPAQSGTACVKRPVSSTGTTTGIPTRATDFEIVLAEARRQVHDAGALVGRDEVGGEHAEGVLGVREEREERAVRQSAERGTLALRDDAAPVEFLREALARGFGDQHAAIGHPAGGR